MPPDRETYATLERTGVLFYPRTKEFRRSGPTCPDDRVSTSECCRAFHQYAQSWSNPLSNHRPDEERKSFGRRWHRAQPTVAGPMRKTSCLLASRIIRRVNCSGMPSAMMAMDRIYHRTSYNDGYRTHFNLPEDISTFQWCCRKPNVTRRS